MCSDETNIIALEGFKHYLALFWCACKCSPYIKQGSIWGFLFFGRDLSHVAARKELFGGFLEGSRGMLPHKILKI